MRRLTKQVFTAAALVIAVLGLAACEASSREEESDRQQSGYDQLVAGQPAESMDYSPTRETINFWIETWSEPNKLSYVYLQNADGEMIGYYVLKGLPVSYCAMLTPNYEILDPTQGGVSVPAPGMDGAYYSGQQCDSYYGQDATTGAYIEYTAGMGINVLLYDKPLPRQDAQPLGPTSVGDVED
ncbi:hypothetical protein HDA32_003282 [Spinactinospora alkalitolerans]|uniref:Lipoprotein n=1 Tax=Spinactinospora alkalitolerans TaxID=687207 RepID=A0A852TYT4_9ACTN|nr:hypothetical protein [Spinactinospora alkalitolerans]NYE48162.1 hypothetical protein [Spinactinospora alkalitolerans]